MTIFTNPVVKPVMHGISRTLMTLSRWKLKGELPEERPFMIIMAPHTSNWDFLILFAMAMTLPLNVRWIGKHQIFRPPFRAVLKWIGGVPVNRDAPGGVVEEAVKVLKSPGGITIGMAPEGTRSKVDRWKTGFYRIARAAEVPILMAGIDYPSKTVTIHGLFRPTGEMEKDIADMQVVLGTHRARYPEKQL